MIRNFSKLAGSSKRWMERHTSDVFVKKSTAENMRSRSAFKITEIQEKKNIVKANSFVLDLGSAPGGWSVAVSKFIDSEAGGKICAVDLLPMDSVPCCTFIQGDFTTTEVRRQVLEVGEGRFPDVILSDMMCNRSGHRGTDSARSEELFYTVLDFSAANLKRGGSMVVKILRGEEDKAMLADAKKLFAEVQMVKPAASRSESAEIYIVATKKL